MSYEHEPISPMFRIDVSADAEAEAAARAAAASHDVLDVQHGLAAGPLWLYRPLCYGSLTPL